jgi:Alpha-L-arabinofuranosidase B, catalytic
MISSHSLRTLTVAALALFGSSCSSTTPSGGSGGSGPATGGGSGGASATATGGVGGSGGDTSGGAGGNGSGGKTVNGAGGSADGGSSGAGKGGSGNGGAGSGGSAGASSGSSRGGADSGGSGGSSSSGSGGRTTGDGGAGGAPDAALAGAGGASVAYQGPCDVVAGGCAEAYSVARAMTASYTGPLFQLGKASDKNAATLDVGQTSDHKADMTTWSAYCSGTQSNCVLSKIYAQIHKGSNDLLPAVWKTPWNPDCSAGGYACAAKFTIEAATGLPIITTVAPQEYALRTDTTENFATGVNGGSKAMGIMYNGKPLANQSYCCGTFGLTHKYNATDTYGTDFMAALAYGWRDSGGCCIAVNCGKANTYCVGAEEEENNDLVDYGTSPVDNAMVVTQFDPNPTATHGTVITYLNGAQVLSKSPPAPLSRGNYPINAATAIHLGGGGDLSQPAPVLMREGLITNNVMTASEVTAMKANLVAFYSPLKFP